jgi:hypothetical protein
MLESTDMRDTYTGDDSTATYDYNFKIYDEDHLLVVVTDTDGEAHTLTIDTDYTVTGIESSAGGTVVLVDNGQEWISATSFLDTDMILSITRDIPYKQTESFRNQAAYYPEAHEDSLDKIVMQIQKLDDGLSRCIKATVADFTESLILPTAALRANMYLTFDADGSPTATASVDPGAVLISAFAETLLDDASASVARATLGFAGTGGTAQATNIEDGAIVTAKINDLAVTTGKIADANVTKAKLSESAKYLTFATCTTTHSIAATTEYLRATTSVAGYVITLPAAASYSGREITVEKVTSDFYQLTLTDGVLTTYLNIGGATTTVASNGTAWYVKNKHVPRSWTAYTPTGAWFGGNVTYTGLYRASGDDSIDLQIKVALTGAPPSASLNIAIPSGLTITTAKLLDTTTGVAALNGDVSIRDAAPENYSGMVRYYSTTSIILYRDDGDGTVSAVSELNPITFASGDFIIVHVYGLPVSGAVAAWGA